MTACLSVFLDIASKVRKLDIGGFVVTALGQRDNMVESGAHRMRKMKRFSHALMTDLAGPTVTLKDSKIVNIRPLLL